MKILLANLEADELRALIRWLALNQVVPKKRHVEFWLNHVRGKS
jgi:hypothetical protein